MTTEASCHHIKANQHEWPC